VLRWRRPERGKVEPGATPAVGPGHANGRRPRRGAGRIMRAVAMSMRYRIVRAMTAFWAWSRFSASS
jgi:hypothetical protein